MKKYLIKNLKITKESIFYHKNNIIIKFKILKISINQNKNTLKNFIKNNNKNSKTKPNPLLQKIKKI